MKGIARTVGWIGTGLGSALVLGTAPLIAVEPSFDCGKAEGEVEQLICADEDLAALDREMAAVWKEVQGQMPDVGADLVRAEQRGWIGGRNACWQADDLRTCISDSYTRRIAELQAAFALVPATGPIVFACDGNPANEVVATFFKTEPATARLERGDTTVIAFRERSASGARYLGPNQEFWNQGDEARVTWGYGAEPLICRRQKK